MTALQPNQAPAQAGSHQPGGWRTLAAGVLVGILTFLAFWPALDNQFLKWDDDQNLTENPHFRGLGGEQLRWMFSTFHVGHYQPVTWLTLGFDHEWGGAVFGDHPEYGPGMDPRAYHLTNNLLHAINAALIAVLALRLLIIALPPTAGRSRIVSLNVAAAMAALLWGVHPLRVENVAWITERRDLVSALLIVLTLLTYLRAVDPTQRRRGAWLGASLALYITSLMAKVAGVPLIAVLVLLDWYPLKRLGWRPGGWTDPGARRVWLEKLPFAVASLAFALVASIGQSRAGWLYPMDDHPLPARVAQSFFGLIFYLWKTIAPLNLLPLYELKLPLDLSHPRFIGAVAAVLLGGVALLLLRRRWPAVAVVAACHVVMLAPVLGLFQNGPQIVADRYSYLPSIGWMILLAGGSLWASLRARNPRAIQVAMLIIGAGAVAALSALTWRQCGVWRDTLTLWAYNVSRDPASAVSNTNYGGALLRAGGDVNDAVPYFRKAVQLDPRFKKGRENLRIVLRAAGRIEEAAAVWVEEAAMGGPGFAEHKAAADEALRASDDDRALEHSLAAVQLRDDPQVRNNIGLLLSRKNRIDDAIEHYRRAIELDANLPQPRHGLAVMYSRRGERDRAVAELRALLARHPGHAPGRELLRQLTGSDQP